VYSREKGRDDAGHNVGLGAWVGGENYGDEDDRPADRRRRSRPPPRPRSPQRSRRGSIFATEQEIIRSGAPPPPRTQRWAYDVAPDSESLQKRQDRHHHQRPRQDGESRGARAAAAPHGSRHPADGGSHGEYSHYANEHLGSARGASSLREPPATTRRRSTLWKVTADAMSGTKAELLERFDRAVTARVLMMFLNAVLSIAQMIAWNQSTGDGDGIGSNRFDRASGIGRGVQEVLLLLGTLLLAVQTVEYYLYQRRYEGRSWHLLDSRQWAQWRWPLLATEIFVIVIHPYPGCDNEAGRYAGTWMFMRLYTACRVIRNLSASYRARDQILRSRAFRMAGSVQFSWAFCFRILFMSNPWIFVIFAVLYSLASIAYTLYIFERVVPFSDVSQPWTLREALWCTVITMTTVGYGDTIPYSQEGRIVVSFAALIGVVLASILIFIIINSLTPSLLERHAHTIRKARWWSARLEYLSTRLIQIWVRHYLWRRGLGAPVPHFQHRNNLLKAKIRGIRRKIALLEIDTIKAVEELELARMDTRGAGDLADVVSGVRGDHVRVMDGPMIDASAAISLGLGPRHGDRRAAAVDDGDSGSDRAGARRAFGNINNNNISNNNNNNNNNMSDDEYYLEDGPPDHGAAAVSTTRLLHRVISEQRALRHSVDTIARNQELILEMLNNSKR
jgi:hypothetical protein